jgi:hypothetical protein
MKEPDNSPASSERSTELEKSIRKQTWVITLATPILTALLSWFLNAYQLGSEHSFYSRQKLEDRQQNLKDEKRHLLGDVARLSGLMLGSRKQMAIDALGIYLREIATMKTGHEFGGENGGDLARYQTADREDRIHFFSADAEAESVFKMATILFGPNAPLTDALSGVMSKFNAQIQAENEYSNSVYDVINTMASELAGDYTTTSK